MDTLNKEVYFQPNLSDEEWYNNKDFNTTDVFRSFANAKARFPNNEIGAYSGNDIEDKHFVDSEINLTCCKCKNVEHYESDEELFQGEMWGLEDGTIICNKCLENS